METLILEKNPNGIYKAYEFIHGIPPHSPKKATTKELDSFWSECQYYMREGYFPVQLSYGLVAIKFGDTICKDQNGKIYIENHFKSEIMNKIFLGGTCANSAWREQLIPLLKIPFFNPVVDDWTPECAAEEERQKDEICNVHLYVISKEMMGVFSAVEALDSAYQRGQNSIFWVLPDGFERHALKSLEATARKIKQRGGVAFVDDNIEELANYLNDKFAETPAEV